MSEEKKFDITKWFADLGLDEKKYGKIFAKYDDKPKEFRLLTFQQIKSILYESFGGKTEDSYMDAIIKITDGIQNMIPYETIWVMDIEHTGKKENAIGYAIQRLNWITGEVKTEKERELYITRQAPKGDDYGDYAKDTYDEYWEGAKYEWKKVTLKEAKELASREWEMVMDKEKKAKKTKDGKFIYKSTTATYPQREQRLLFEKNGKHEAWVYQEIIDDFEVFCKKYNSKKYRVIGDHPAFDYGTMNASIQRIFGNKVKDLNYIRKWKDGKKSFRHKRPACIGTYYEGVNALIYGPKEDGKWFMKDIPELKKILDECPFEHDHMPVNDAKTMGWKYLKVKYWMYKQGFEPLNEKKRKIEGLEGVGIDITSKSSTGSIHIKTKHVKVSGKGSIGFKF